MNTPSWTYDSGYPSIFQGEGLNRTCVCLKSHWQALIHFFMSTWKRNSLLPQRYEVPRLIVTSTALRQVSACDWEMCQKPLYPHPFRHFRTQIRNVWCCAWFLSISQNEPRALFLENVGGTWFQLVSWESNFALGLLRRWRRTCAIPTDCILSSASRQVR